MTQRDFNVAQNARTPRENPMFDNGRTHAQRQMRDLRKTKAFSARLI